MQNYFTWLSKQSHVLMKKGKWDELILCLREMAGIMHGEERFVDELKLYMLMLHITIEFNELEHFGAIRAMQDADKCSGLMPEEKERLFFDTDIEGLCNKVPVYVKFLVYQLCIENKIDEATVLIHNRLVKYR